MNRITIDNVKDMNLEHVFECGQCFRWNDENGDGTYIGVASSHICHAKLEDDRLILDVTGGSEEFWRDYFDLNTDYSEYKRRLLSTEPKIEPAIVNGYGIRILRQDFFEVLISFIVSQNNNIPRIKKCIESICRTYGDELGEYNGVMRYSFPAPEVLANASVSELAELKLGYRCEYIVRAAEQFLREGKPDDSMTTEEFHKALLSYHGIGPKVANCILLFGIRDFRAFPIDVWVKKIMNDMYGFELSNIKGMQKFAYEHFGELSGIAQQYLFFYYRGK